MSKKKVKKKSEEESKVVKIRKGKAKEAEAAPENTVNTAVEAVKEYAIQLKGRAEEGKVRGVLIIEFGVNPADGGVRRAGAVSGQEAAFGALMIQQMVIGNLGEKLPDQS